MVEMDLEEFIEIKFEDFFNNLAVNITRKYDLNKKEAEDAVMEWLQT